MTPIALLAATCSLISLASCTAEHTSGPNGPNGGSQETSQMQPTGKVLDGSFGDWAKDETSYADERWIWIRFAPATRPPQAIQAAEYSTRVRIDADMNPRTGQPIEYPRTGMEAIGVQPQGVDVLFAFSPENEEGGIGIGTGVTVFDSTGSVTQSGHAAFGLACLPTYGNDQYELRVDRLAPGSAVLPESGMIEVVIDQVDASGKQLWSHKLTVDLPQLARTPQLKTTALPIRPAKGVRVMSANVLYSSPLEQPEPFERILKNTMLHGGDKLQKRKIKSLSSFI